MNDHRVRPALTGPRWQTGVNALFDKSSFWKLLLGMRAVGLKVLKNKLSEYVRLVQSGETVLVTDRDRVVAELVPPRAERSPMVADAFLADAVRRGWVTPPTVASDDPPPRLPVAPLSEVLSGLDEDRSER